MSITELYAECALAADGRRAIQRLPNHVTAQSGLLSVNLISGNTELRIVLLFTHAVNRYKQLRISERCFVYAELLM